MPEKPIICLVINCKQFQVLLEESTFIFKYFEDFYILNGHELPRFLHQGFIE